MTELKKDELYYYDLIYELKDICNLHHSDEREKDTEARIYQRKNDIRTVYTNGSGIMKQDFRMSEFNSDVMRCLRRISDIASQQDYGMNARLVLTNIARLNTLKCTLYTEAINIMLQELEEKKLSVASNDDVMKKRI